MPDGQVASGGVDALAEFGCIRRHGGGITSRSRSRNHHVVAVDARCCLTIDPELIGIANNYFILLLAVLFSLLLIDRHKNPPVQLYY